MPETTVTTTEQTTVVETIEQTVVVQAITPEGTELVETEQGTTVVEVRVQGPQGPAGPTGADGADGLAGENGLSAYEVALENGFVGTEAAWLASLVGPPGSDGVDGADGADGDAADIAAEIHAATDKATPVDADEFGIVDSAASNVLKKLTWANLKSTLKTYFDTLYAAMPFTTARFTLQTSVPSAASTGEAKLSVRDMAGLGILSLRSLSGHYLVFPEFTDPMVRGSWISSGSTRATKGIPSGFSNAGTVSGAQLTGLEFANLASAATTNSTAQTSNNNQYSVTSGGTYNGYHCWTTVQLPDASYGSGATGVSIFVGLCSGSNLATVLTSDRILTSQVAAGFSFDTKLSDTNWKFTVRSGSSTNITTTDTGIAFATGKHWLFMWYAPSGGSDTYWFIANITDGTSAGGTTARQHGSVGAGEVVGLVTRDNVARNIRIGDYWVRHGASY